MVIMSKAIASGTARMMDSIQINTNSIAIHLGTPIPLIRLHEATARYLEDRTCTVSSSINKNQSKGQFDIKGNTFIHFLAENLMIRSLILKYLYRKQIERQSTFIWTLLDPQHRAGFNLLILVLI